MFNGQLHHTGQPGLCRLHSGQPGRGGADRPLRRRRGDPLHVALLRRRDADRTGERLQPDRASRWPPVPLRLHRRPLHRARPRRRPTPRWWTASLARGSDGVHITAAAWTTSLSPRSTRSSPTWRGPSTPATPRPHRARAVAAIAHRGEPVGHRENTLPAFAAAVALGADMVEIDLRRTRDGAIVVLHDQTLERLWGLEASVGDVDLAEVATLGGDGDVAHPHPGRGARRGAAPADGRLHPARGCGRRRCRRCAARARSGAACSSRATWRRCSSCGRGRPRRASG